MATSLPKIEFVAIYDIAYSRLRKFSMFAERERVRKFVLSPPIRPLDAVRHIIRERPDLIIFHGYNLPSLLAGIGYCIVSGTRYALFSDTNVLQETRTDRSSLAREALSFIISHAYRIFFSSTVNRRYWQKMGARMDQLVPLWFPVNNEKIQKIISDKTILATLRSKFAELSDRLIVCCARLAPVKDIPTLLRAVSILPKNFKLVVVGDGPERNKLEILSGELGITSRSSFLGSVNNDDAIRHIAISDIFVLPSLFEPFGLVVNEAVSVGLPVIASDIVGAAYDLVDEGRNGFIFKRGDHAQLAEKIVACESLSRKDIEVKRREVLERFSFEQNAQSLEAVLKE